MLAPDVARTRAAELSTMEAKLLALLRSARLPCDTELVLQDEIEKLLMASGLPYRREAKVAGGRIDFLVGAADRFGPHVPSVGLEVKIGGGSRAIHRQCSAYCGDPRIGSLIVVSATSLALPSPMNGRVVTVLSVGAGWL